MIINWQNQKTYDLINIMNPNLKFDDKERNISALTNFQRINILYFGGKLEVRDLVNRVLNVGLAEA